MRLTRYTDYSLRVLMYLGAHDNQRVTIKDISGHFNISRNHLMKVVHNLSVQGYVHTFRGTSGGMVLARPAGEIVVGDVVRSTEKNLDAVDCHNPECPISEACRLQGVFHEAVAAFLEVLDGYTLEDLVANRELLQVLTAGEA